MNKDEVIKGLIELIGEKKEEKQKVPKITIITVCYNQLHHTKRFIESLLRFTVPPFQIIAVNNGSTDGTKEYLHSKADWLSKENSLCVLNEGENLGWVGGINKALSFVDLSSDFVVFANNDVVVDQDWNVRLLKHFDPTVGAVGPISNFVAGRQNRVFNCPGITEEETRFLIGFFICIRKGLIKELGPLDDLHSFEIEGSKPSGADDLDYSIRIRNQGYKLVIARDVFVWHAGAVSNADKLTIQEYAKLCEDANQALSRKWGEDIWADLQDHPTKVLCAVPMRSDYCHRRFAFSFSTMHKPFRFDCADIARAHVESARNAAVRFAREKGFNYLLFLDDDHILPPDLFVRLYNINQPVAAALAFKRVPPYDPVIGKWGIMENGDVGVMPQPEMIHTGVQRVDAVGFAAVLIKMEVFDQLEERKLGWFKWGLMGEDFQFCLNCKDAGIPIYCDTDLVVPHIGVNQEVDENTFYSFNPNVERVRK